MGEAAEDLNLGENRNENLCIRSDNFVSELHRMEYNGWIDKNNLRIMKMNSRSK